ncbi:MAG: ABC transporter substrate-binding protein [Alphaproteobacteria bacterium]|nr:ABC transporter substrate-binding protein [Alphaproteobacteria bacterium]
MIRFLLPILLIGLIWVAPAAARQDAQAQQQARDFIEDLGERTIDLLSNPDATPQSLVDDFKQLFRQRFDTNTIGRFVLGRHWNQASPQQRQEYLDVFREFVVQTYAQRFSEYSGQRLQIEGTRPAGSSDIMVSARIVDPNGAPPVAVDWRVRVQNGEVKIVDVMVENVSMAITYRNEFNSVIQRQGGSVAGLIQALRQRVEEMRAS